MRILFVPVLLIVFLSNAVQAIAETGPQKANGTSLSGPNQKGSPKGAALHNESVQPKTADVPLANPLKLKIFENLKGRFTQVKTLKELGVEIKSEGQFQVSGKSQTDRVLHWNVEKPKPSQVCIDAKGVTLTSNGSTKKISFSEMGPESGEQMSSLLKLISLDPARLALDFDIQPVGEDFQLTPLKPETVFFKSAQVHVNPNGLVDHVFLQEKSTTTASNDKAQAGDELKVHFTNLSTAKNKKIDSCAF